MVSSDDHCQEVVGLCREKTYAGLVGCSGEYLVFQPPRYFSSSQLKLTYRVCIINITSPPCAFILTDNICFSITSNIGDPIRLLFYDYLQSSLETKEYKIHELPQVLEVPQDRLCLVAALLGGTILSEQSLMDFYKRLGVTPKKVKLILYENFYIYTWTNE